MTCDPLGMPRNLFLEVSAYDLEFAQGLPGRVMQLFEWQHAFRNIWTDGRKLPTDAEPTWNGYSIGHWDGNTFVVETTGLDDTGRPWIDHFGNPIDGNAKITEKAMTRVDHDHLANGGSRSTTLPHVQGEVGQQPPRRLPWFPTATSTEIFCVPSEEESFNSGHQRRRGRCQRPRHRLRHNLKLKVRIQTSTQQLRPCQRQ